MYRTLLTLTLTAFLLFLNSQTSEGSPHSRVPTPRPMAKAQVKAELLAWAETAVREELTSEQPFEKGIEYRYYNGQRLACIGTGEPAANVWDSRHGPVGTVHYNIRPRWRGARGQNCGRHASACAFLKVADVFHGVCKGPGCRVQFGDFFSPRAHRIHSSHESAQCVDVMPFRKNDDNLIGFSIASAHGRQRYSAERTRAFIALARAMGATTIIFNDPAAQPDLMRRGHFDHIHMCFPEGSQLVQASCKGNASQIVASIQQR